MIDFNINIQNSAYQCRDAQHKYNMFSLQKILTTDPFFKYESSKRKALEINHAFVELGSEGMHLMVRHHSLHLP